MKNVTISLDEELLERSRAFARRQGKSFNDLVRDMLRRTVEGERLGRVEELFAWGEANQIRPEGGQWLTREEAHER